MEWSNNSTSLFDLVSRESTSWTSEAGEEVMDISVQLRAQSRAQRAMAASLREASRRLVRNSIASRTGNTALQGF